MLNVTIHLILLWSEQRMEGRHKGLTVDTYFK